MNIIFSTLIVILIILLFTIFAAWIDKFNAKHKEAFFEKSIDKVSSLLTSKIALVMEQYKVGPWYLVYILRKPTTLYGSLTTISAAYTPT